jgi:hypothetical protein
MDRLAGTPLRTTSGPVSAVHLLSRAGAVQGGITCSSSASYLASFFLHPLLRLPEFALSGIRPLVLARLMQSDKSDRNAGVLDLQSGKASIRSHSQLPH